MSRYARSNEYLYRESESKIVILRDYVNDRLDDGDTDAVIEGLQNNVRSSLVDALNNVPREDWHAEISNRQKETDGQTLIWLAGNSDPSYSIQE